MSLFNPKPIIESTWNAVRDFLSEAVNVFFIYKVFTVAGFAVCLLAFSGIWRACRTMRVIFNSDKQPSFASPQNKLEDNVHKKNLLQLIKKAYNPEYAKTAIEQLNNCDIDVNEKISSSGLTFFLWGCLCGNEDIIRILLKKGADVEAETNDGDSALYLATYTILHLKDSNTHALQLLIRAGCNVNQQNLKGFTPLHRAASKGNMKVIKFLLSEGADPYLANSAGVYPIDSAVCGGHLEAAKLMQLKFPSHQVWDVVEPHTPPQIKMGLQSPHRKLLLASSRAPAKLPSVFT